MVYSYLFEPKAPLVFRNAKPFGQTAAGETLDFPWPSTIAGALRTAYGESTGMTYETAKDALVQTKAAGPLAARWHVPSRQVESLWPRPADALYLGEETPCAKVYALQPTSLKSTEGCGLPQGLWPPSPPNEQRGKPLDGPAFWDQQTMYAWLLAEGRGRAAADMGISALPIALRSHVAIDPGTLGSRDGQLFQTQALDFGPRRQEGRNGWEDYEYGLLARFSESLPDVYRRLGGEGRLAYLRRVEGVWPELPATLRQSLTQTRRLRLILVTPAMFTGGWVPGWLDENWEGSPPGLPACRLRLRAAALARWQAVSGWDLADRKARACRRAVPAGSVYWFEIIEGDINMPEGLWLAPVSDREQDRRDGFGLVLPGVWKD